MNIQKAKKIIDELLYFIKLVEEYKATTFKQIVIKEYAKLGSIAKVTENLISNGYDVNSTDISKIINERATDELHKVIKRYRKKYN